MNLLKVFYSKLMAQNKTIDEHAAARRTAAVAQAASMAGAEP
jgi:hypothetical protein